MKKFVAMMVLVILTMSLTVMAQAAELHVRSWRGITVDNEMKYYVTFESDAGERHEFLVTEEEFYDAVEELAAQKKAEQKKAEKEAKKAEKKAKKDDKKSIFNPGD